MRASTAAMAFAAIPRHPHISLSLKYSLDKLEALKF
jgi:hypothetical protein